MTEIRNFITPYIEKVSPSARTFIQHYLEMLLAMFVGMLPFEAIVLMAGSSTGELGENNLVALLLGMTVSMTVPMVAWMRHRGHSWQLSLEM
jgi:hypothetical protein